MFDKKIKVEILPEIKLIPIGKNNLVILRIKGNLSDKQYTRIKEQLKEVKIDGVTIRVFLVEGGIFVETILTDAGVG